MHLIHLLQELHSRYATVKELVVVGRSVGVGRCELCGFAGGRGRELIGRDV
jgi:hypothetical protein